ncbi:MAG TPA: TolC family protein [Bdellovibrionota bacterium]
MRTIVGKILLGTIFLAASAWGDLPAITIQDSVRTALDRNPDVLKAREAVQQSQANVSLAISKVFPTIDGQLKASWLKASSASSSPLFGGKPYNQYLAALNLDQPVYDGAIFSGYSYSKKDVQIKQYKESIAERDLSQKVLENFYSVLLHERLLGILQEALKVDNETLKIAERWLSTGRAQKVDVLQLRTQAALRLPKIAETENKMRISAAELATLLRNLDAGSIRIRGALVTPEASWVKKNVQQKKQDLPEMLQAKELVNQFEDNREVQMAKYWPSLGVLGNLQRQAYTKRELIDANTTSWSVALVLDVPLFAGLSSFHQRASLAAEQRQLELDETHTADTVSVNQIQAEKDFAVALTQLDSARKAAEFGRQTIQEAQRQYRFQTINYLQYQSSQQAFLDSQTGYFQAKYNYIVSLSKYFNAMGVPSEVLIAKLDELSRQQGAGD